MKKTKLEKGITLVALIITIVVLLILAVVSIGAVKNSGIIGHATNTSDAWKQAQAKENSYLEGYEEKLAESSGAKVVKYVGEVPIPAGFKYLEGDKDTGLVIKNTTEGSEFVWIPVDSGSLPSVSGEEPTVVTRTYDISSSTNIDGADMNSENLAKAGITEGTTKGISENNSKLFLSQLTAEYEAMKTSVEKYKGFYVGRYEVSIGSNGKAQSVKGATSANASSSSADTWYGLYKLCKTYKTSSVTSSMIWGCQYEAILEFIGDVERRSGINKTEQTGTEEKDKIKNIYDLYGNSSEWTLEKQSSYGLMVRVSRGENRDSDIGSPSDRNLNFIGIPENNPELGSSRLTLYVEL